MPRVEVTNSEGNLLGVIDDEKRIVEKTEEWERIQEEARKRRKKPGGGGSKPPKKRGKTWSVGY